MRTKICHTCKQEFNSLLLISTAKTNGWIFVCKDDNKIHQKEPSYQYGGTWLSHLEEEE